MTLADSRSDPARFDMTFPMAVIARHFTRSSILHKKEKSGLTTCRGGSRLISESPSAKSFA